MKCNVISCKNYVINSSNFSTWDIIAYTDPEGILCGHLAFMNGFVQLLYAHAGQFFDH